MIAVIAGGRLRFIFGTLLGARIVTSETKLYN